MLRPGFLSAFLVFAIVCPAIAQTSSGAIGAMTAGPPVQEVIVATGGTLGAALPFNGVKGRPYSAEQVSEHSQTLADGTHIVQTNARSLLYRDSEGRTRTERQLTPPLGAVMARPPVFIEILDPIAGYHYTLDAQNHTARRIAWPPAIKRMVDPANPARPANGTFAIPGAAQNSGATQSGSVNQMATAPSSQPRPQHKREPLGTQTMEGLTVEGTRVTTTFPEGVMGNDRPFTTTSETWISHDLQLTILSRTSDPRNGETTMKLTNISQGEPDISLFQVPADYTITDQQ